jgi:hypothetical protein
MFYILYHDSNNLEYSTKSNHEANLVKNHYTFKLENYMVKNKPTWLRGKKPTKCLISENRYLPRGLLYDLIDLLEKNNIDYRIDPKLIIEVNLNNETIKKYGDKLDLSNFDKETGEWEHINLYSGSNRCSLYGFKT